MFLELKGITKKFPGVLALSNVDFDVDKGEIHCLVGANGSGKSTLIKVISGVYPDYEGKIFLESQKRRISSPRDARELGIGAIQQERDLAPTLDSVANIFLGNEIIGRGNLLDRQLMLEEAKRLVDRFGVEIDLTVPVGELSIPDQEVVAISKALARKCRLLMIDEASAPLDRNERKQLFGIIRSFKKEGLAIIYISHFLEEIFEIGDRVTVLKDGRAVWTKSIQETSLPEIIRAMVGEVQARPHKEQRALGEKILSVKNLGVPRILKDIDFDLRKGEILGITGLAGSGRAELAEAIFGLFPKMSGIIDFQGKQIRVRQPRDAVACGIGLVPDGRREKGLVVCRSVSENISHAQINKQRSFRVSPAAIRKLALEFVKILRIRVSTPAQRAEYLSGGNQQKVVLAKWLATQCNLLLLIEPTEGVDVQVRQEIYSILLDFASAGKSVILISGDLDEILQVCDRVLVMTRGRIKTEFLTTRTNKQEVLESMLS